MNKLKLQKLIDIVIEFAEMKGNEWMKTKLMDRVGVKSSTNAISAPKIEEIYEYCLRKIVREHAEQFYRDFKLVDIKDKLIEDFVRMEKFRREDNFEDFCLAAYQQIEGIVNALSNSDVKKYIIDSKEIIIGKERNKETGNYEEKKLKHVVFYYKLSEEDLLKKLEKEMLEWDFNEKYKSILLFYYYNKKYIGNYSEFQRISILGFELYQARNLNHRGGKITEKQQKTINKVQSNSHKYYFKFIGFLEDFSSRLNYNIITE